MSAIGDVVHAVPVVRTLQAHWPTTKITWIVGKVEHGLVGDIPGVTFIVFDKSRGRAAYRDVKRDLDGCRFDVLLHMQASMRANLASRHVRSPVRLGFDRVRAKDFQWLFTTHRTATVPCQHVMDGFFGFLEALGLRQKLLQWDIPIPEEAEQSAARRLTARAPILAINPCVKARRLNWRNWSVENYASVANRAAERHGMQVVLTGGSTAIELEAGERIEALCSRKPVNLIGKTSLKELLAVLKSAAVLLAPDTGPAHMANAVGTPVIGLYATSNPLRTGPYSSREWVVNKYPEALSREYGITVEDARWGRRVRNRDAMNLISVADVNEKLDALVAHLKETGLFSGTSP